MKQADVRVVERLDLIHALCQYVADSEAIDILAVKGAVARRHFEGRGGSGSDADILVRPGHADRYVGALQRAGWSIGRDAHELDLSNHAVVLENPLWACTIDVHRHFPGFASSAVDVFEELWRRREPMMVGGRTCWVPSRAAHGAVLIVNAARNPAERDTKLVLDAWTAGELREGVGMVNALGGADAAATRLPELFRPEKPSHYWRVVSDRPTGAAMWMARIWDTPGLVSRLRLVGYALVPPPVWGQDNSLRHRVRRVPAHWSKGARQFPGAALRMARMLKSR